MAYYLSPIGNTQTFDANGDPLVGGTISTFLAGTSTTATTYTDDTGGTSQGVVMTLNSLGYPTNGPVWMLGGVPLKFIIKNAAGTTQSTFDDISGIGDTATASDEWVLYGAAPTYISATSFSVVGDQTNTFQVLRKLKSSNSGGTTYSTIATSAFAAGVTTVTVTNTSGTLDSGMSAVSYGLLSATNPSVPESAIGKLLRVASTTAAARTAIEVFELGTAVASTSGTSIDFTGIPSGVKRVTVMLNGVSTNGTSNILVQLGDSGGVETSGYTSRSNDASGQVTSTAGFVLTRALGTAADTQFGQAIISLLDSATNTWVQTANINDVGQNAVVYSAGAKALTATLDRVRVTTVNGTDTFDAGTVNISWE